MRAFFEEKSGGKKVIATKKCIIVGGGLSLPIFLIMNYLAPKEDRTAYTQTSKPSELSRDMRGIQQPTLKDFAMGPLFASGARQREAAKRKDSDDRRKRSVILYRAPQLIDENASHVKAMRMGSKLIGVLASAIDTRAASLVRVVLPHGGDISGVAIDAGSTLVGQFTYPGDGDRVYLTFSRIDSSSGNIKKLSAVALDAGSFSSGIRGEEFTGGGTKLAANLGLSMFSGMADTLTERESLGGSYNGVQAKPSAKNALLQGLSKATQEQASRLASSIEQERNYVIIPQGKEMIIELIEDFGK